MYPKVPISSLKCELSVKSAKKRSLIDSVQFIDGFSNIVIFSILAFWAFQVPSRDGPRLWTAVFYQSPYGASSPGVPF